MCELLKTVSLLKSELINEKISPKIKIFQTQINSGPAAARNLGIKNANGKWYCYDDKNVSEIDESKIKSNNSYVLFYRKKRNTLINRLQKNKIPSVVYYKFPIHLMEAFQYLGCQKGSLPISENLSHSIVSLPMHPYLTAADIDFIVNTIQTK